MDLWQCHRRQTEPPQRRSDTREARDEGDEEARVCRPLAVACDMRAVLKHLAEVVPPQVQHHGDLLVEDALPRGVCHGVHDLGEGAGLGPVHPEVGEKHSERGRFEHHGDDIARLEAFAEVSAQHRRHEHDLGGCAGASLPEGEFGFSENGCCLETRQHRHASQLPLLVGDTQSLLPQTMCIQVRFDEREDRRRPNDEAMRLL